MTARGLLFWMFGGSQAVAAVAIWLLVRRWWAYAWIWPTAGVLWAGMVAALLWGGEEA